MADENSTQGIAAVLLGKLASHSSASISGQSMRRTLSDKSNYMHINQDIYGKENMEDRTMICKSQSLPSNKKGLRNRKPLERSENSQDSSSDVDSSISTDSVEELPVFDTNNNGYSTPTKVKQEAVLDESSLSYDPTCNLQLLLSAASPEIKRMEREREKSLEEDRSSAASSMMSMAFSGYMVSPCEENNRDFLMSSQDSQVGTDTEMFTSRKDKSLGRLCDK